MQYELLNILKCPLSKTDLKFTLISEFEKKYEDEVVTEVYEGLLFSETGFVFPVIKGIPRMLMEGIDDFQEFLKKHLDNYEDIRSNLKAKFPGLLNYCYKKNEKTKKSFEFEWSFLNRKRKDKIWQVDVNNFSRLLFDEVGETENYFKNKTVIDVGSGHGVMTSQMAKISKYAIGVELSKAVENAYSNNNKRCAWYIQGDLQFLPFQNENFDILYSSGVLHHTNNTELSLSLTESVLKNQGKICLWLYHPQKSKLHNFFLFVRKITSKLPLRIAFVFLSVFIFPFTFLIKKIKRKRSVNYREELIYLLDFFTPEFRFETTHDMASLWLMRRGYKNIKITTSDQFGFSMVGEK
jgi:ubiquinone/menaquinone biosynthesis C-methylase UbiE/uncharacterized protein YbaR (Trm112 family)